ncbi:MAG: hypothetical protein ACK501_19490 [Planctomycetota bacterium]
MRAPSSLVVALAGLVFSSLPQAARAQQGSLPPAPPPPAAGKAEAAAPAAAAATPTRDELTNKVAGILRDTACVGLTSFTELSQWEFSPRGPNPNPPPQRTTRGVFSPDHLHLEQDGDEAILVVAVGRGFVAKKGDGPWLLAGRGARVLPNPPSDPSLLLRAVAEQLTPVLDRSLGERDGLAIETYVSVLARPQIAALVDAGAIWEPNASVRMLTQLRLRGRALQVEMPPDEVDVRIDVDVRSRRVVALSLRAVTKAVEPAVLMLATRGQPAAPVAAEAPAVPRPASAFTFRDGWPVRETEGLEVRTIELRLSEHGRAELPPLDAEAKRLLGR